MQLNFTVLGQPQGKGRPKFSVVCGHARARTPDKTVFYENLVKIEFQRQCGENKFLDDDSLSMLVTAFYSIPKSATKAKKALMLEGKIRPGKKPDADNIFKVVADSLNDIAYKDDAQIVDATIKKYYADVPRVEVAISVC